MSARLIGIGVGPGDPGLLTLKAIAALGAADVVAHFAKEGNNSNARTIAAAHFKPGAEELDLVEEVGVLARPVDRLRSAHHHHQRGVLVPRLHLAQASVHLEAGALQGGSQKTRSFVLLVLDDQGAVSHRGPAR